MNFLIEFEHDLDVELTFPTSQPGQPPLAPTWTTTRAGPSRTEGQSQQHTIEMEPKYMVSYVESRPPTSESVSTKENPFQQDEQLYQGTSDFESRSPPPYTEPASPEPIWAATRFDSRVPQTELDLALRYTPSPPYTESRSSTAVGTNGSTDSFRKQNRPNKTQLEIRELPKIRLAKLQPIFGWRLWVTMGCLSLGLLLSALETTIIATALVSISSDLGSYDISNWVATSYMITYTGFLNIFARISDLFGRRTTLITALTIFTLFSLACGLAQTMEQLIVFRAIQGIGGAGLYCLAMSVLLEITPLRFMGVTTGVMGAIFAMASLVGPILGGVITSNTTWRWVFYLNVAPGSIALVLAIFTFPKNVGTLPSLGRRFASLDYTGMVLSLVGCVLIIFALEQGGLVYSWNSAAIITCFVVSGASFFGFGLWEWVLSGTSLRTSILALFPIRLATRRVVGSSLFTSFCLGFPFMVTVIFLPQRFQLQQGISPAESGIRMLPLLTVSAIGAGLGGVISSKRNISWHILVFAICLQLLGLGLMSSLPITGDIQVAQYGYQAILGLGFGLAASTIVVMGSMEVEKKDQNILVGSITQVRMLGGLIGVAACQAILSDHLLKNLTVIIPPEKLAALLHSTAAIRTFTPDEAALTRAAYGYAYNLQTKMAIAFSGAALVACLWAFKRNPEEMSAMEKRRNDEEDKDEAENAGRPGTSSV